MPIFLNKLLQISAEEALLFGEWGEQMKPLDISKVFCSRKSTIYSDIRFLFYCASLWAGCSTKPQNNSCASVSQKLTKKSPGYFIKGLLLLLLPAAVSPLEAPFITQPRQQINSLLNAKSGDIFLHKSRHYQGIYSRAVALGPDFTKTSVQKGFQQKLSLSP